MRALLICLLLMTLGPASAQATGIAPLLAKLGAGTAQERNTATNALLDLPSSDYLDLVDSLIPLHRLSDDPEVRARSGHILESLYRVHVLNEGRGVFGFVLGWSLDHSGSEVTSWPMIVQVATDTPAEEAGFKAGDVIIECNGESTKGLDSRNDLMRRLARLKPGTQTTFKVRFGEHEGAFLPIPKNQVVERTLAPMVRAELGLESRFNTADFRRWLESLAPDDSTP